MVASLCEVCEKRRQVTQGLCHACVVEGLRKVKDEADPNLERYQQLVSRVSVLQFKPLEAAA